MKKFTFACVLTTNLLAVNIAQIDTTKYFPLNIGNYWEYRSIGTEQISWFVWVIGDTVLDNGYEYYTLKNIYDYSDEFYNYYRLDTLNNLYQYVIRPDCNSKDELLYNFSTEDSSIWQICGDMGIGLGPYYYGIYQTTLKNYPIFNTVLETKWFTSVLIDTTVTPPDTLWDPIYGSIGVIKIAKGVGMVESLAELGPWFMLTGAIIDSIQYGTISNIKNINVNFEFFKDAGLVIFPNPFNSTTTIKIILPYSGKTSLTIYNMVGEKVETLIDEFKLEGEYQLHFSASRLSSGIYIAILKTKNDVLINKLILVK